MMKTYTNLSEQWEIWLAQDQYIIVPPARTIQIREGYLFQARHEDEFLAELHVELQLLLEAERLNRFRQYLN